MYSNPLSLFSVITLASTVLAVPQLRPPWGVPDSCVTLPVLITGVGYEIELRVQGSALDGETVTFTEDGEGTLAAVVGNAGEYQNLTFQNSQISAWDGGLLGYPARPVNGASWRQLAFLESPGDPLEFQAAYGCGPDGRAQLELQPAEQSPSTPPLTFCVSYKRGWDGSIDEAYLGLKVKNFDDGSCEEVILTIHEGWSEEQGWPWTTTRPWWFPRPTHIWQTTTRQPWQTTTTRVITTTRRQTTTRRTTTRRTTTRRPITTNRPGGPGPTRTVITQPTRPAPITTRRTTNRPNPRPTITRFPGGGNQGGATRTVLWE